MNFESDRLCQILIATMFTSPQFHDLFGSVNTINVKTIETKLNYLIIYMFCCLFYWGKNGGQSL